MVNTPSSFPAPGGDIWSALERMKNPVGIISSSGFLIRINSAFADLLGLSNPLIDPEIHALQDWISADYTQNLEHAFASQAPLDLVVSFRRFDSNTHWVKLEGERLGKNVTADASGSVPYLLFAKDITEQVKQEEELTLFKTVFESIKDSVIITGGRTQTDAPIDVGIRYVNPAFTEITGYTREEVLGKTPRIFQGPKTSTRELARIDVAIQREEAIEVEYINYRKDGSEFWANTLIMPVFDKEGTLQNWVSIRRDISDRKMDEIKLLRSTEKANSASTAKSKFLSLVSHELRTPLNGIIGNCHLLQQRLSDQADLNILAEIQQSSDRLLSLIRGILDYTDLEKADLALAITEFVPKSFFIRLNEMYAYAAKRKGLSFRYTISPDFPPKLKGDVELLAKAVNHLVQNAIKFTEKGEIQLTFRCRRLSESHLEVHISVKDSGIGISEAQQNKLFKTFSQVDTSDSRNYEGLGLGLSTCKRISEILKGSIWAESTLGEGSTFHFCFPAEKVDYSGSETPVGIQNSPHTPKAEVLVSKPDFSDFRVLIVEDNLLNQKLTQKILMQMKANPSIVENGVEAVEFVKSNSVDLILMDIQMPLMDGIEATTCIRQLTDVHQPVILALTANALEETRKRCLAVGMEAYYTKPIKPTQFKKDLATWIPELQRRKHLQGGPTISQP